MAKQTETKVHKVWLCLSLTSPQELSPLDFPIYISRKDFCLWLYIIAALRSAADLMDKVQ